MLVFNFAILLKSQKFDARENIVFTVNHDLHFIHPKTLFCSLAILDLRTGHNIDVLFPLCM